MKSRIAQSYAMHILVVTPVLACLWLHDCMLCIILQALIVLRQLRRGFCTIVLHIIQVQNNHSLISFKHNSYNQEEVLLLLFLIPSNRLTVE